MPVRQSGYRLYHSTETAVKKVFDELLQAADEGDVSAVCLHDLTAAFDTVDHDLMLLKLERQFSLRGIVLKWFQSYLCDRIFQVVYNGNTSYTVHVTCSVPQGSVLGLWLFIMYTADLEEKADEHGVNYYAFADDTQLNERCRCNDTPTAVGKLEHCVTDINHWMSAHRLKQNTEKTELLWSGSKYSLSKFDGRGPAIKLGSNTIEPGGHVRVLGVIMSSDLSLEKHVSAISATCFFHLRQIRRVRQSLDVGSAKTLVQAFVTSRVDYCNTVLAESPRVITDKLQRVMNSAARVVTDNRKYDSGLSRLMHDELHWLDVTDRVRFKLAVLMY